MILEHNARYRAVIHLGWLERYASNDAVRAKLQEAGFIDVVVWGDGGTRLAEGTWPLATREVDLPSEIDSVTRI